MECLRELHGKTALTFPVCHGQPFTEFHLDLPDARRFLLPIFTFGKYFEQDGKILLPLSIQVHHAVCDGFHLCRFVNECQQLADQCEAWL